MNQKVRYIILLLFLLPLTGKAQDALFDSLNIDSSLATGPGTQIFLDCVPYVDDIPLAINDYIVAYQDDEFLGFTRYSNDSINILTIKDSSKNRNNISFNIYKLGDDTCLLGISEVETAIALDTSDGDSITRITSMKAYSRSINYPKNILCTNDSVIPTSSVTWYNYDISFYSDTDLKFDRYGNIYPSESAIGTHVLKMDSKYCLSSNSKEFTIVEPIAHLVSSDIPVCSNESLNEKINSPVESYSLEAIDSTISGGNYIINYNLIINDSNGCKIQQQINVNYLNSLPVQVSQEYLCDKTRLNVENLNLIEKVSWSNGVTENNVDIYNDTIIELSVTDNNGCINHDTFEISVRPFQVEFVDYDFEPSSCWEFGKISLKATRNTNGIDPYSFSLRNVINDQQISDIEKVPEGIYRLKVRDGRNCEAEYEEDILIQQDCLNNYPVFTPNADGSEDEYFIPYEGSIEIFDKNGRLLKKMETPAYWDGRDSNNNYIPMGNYVIITDQGKAINITIIK